MRFQKAIDILEPIKLAMESNISEAATHAHVNNFVAAIAFLDKDLVSHRLEKDRAWHEHMGTDKVFPAGSPQQGQLKPGKKDTTYDKLIVLEGEIDKLLADNKRLRHEYTSAHKLRADARQAAATKAIPPKVASVEAVLLKPTPPKTMRPKAPKAIPLKAASVEIAPVEIAPVETAPVETAPVETAPVETAPVETAPTKIAQPETADIDAANTGLDSIHDIAYIEARKQLLALMQSDPTLEKLAQPVTNLLAEIKKLKEKGTEKNTDLIQVLVNTYLFLNREDPQHISQEVFDAYVETVEGHPSAGMKVLGVLLVALGLAVATLGILFAPVLVGGLMTAAGTVLSGMAAQIIVGSAVGLTTVGLFETGRRSFTNGLQNGLSKVMRDVSDADIACTHSKPEDTEAPLPAEDYNTTSLRNSSM